VTVWTGKSADQLAWRRKAPGCQLEKGLARIYVIDVYFPSVEFEWDPAKSDATFDLRGFDFGYITRVFLDPRRVERRDTRRDYREARFQTVGEIEGKAYFVVYTRRHDRLRIISARRASAHEERAYREDES